MARWSTTGRPRRAADSSSELKKSLTGLGEPDNGTSSSLAQCRVSARRMRARASNSRVFRNESLVRVSSIVRGCKSIARSRDTKERSRPREDFSMKTHVLPRRSERALLRDAAAHHAQELEGRNKLVADIAEIDARKVYRRAGYDSIHSYCVNEFDLTVLAASEQPPVLSVARRASRSNRHRSANAPRGALRCRWRLRCRRPWRRR
jgi:hypothetical protein